MSELRLISIYLLIFIYGINMVWFKGLLSVNFGASLCTQTDQQLERSPMSIIAVFVCFPARFVAVLAVE